MTVLGRVFQSPLYLVSRVRPHWDCTFRAYRIEHSRSSKKFRGKRQSDGATAMQNVTIPYKLVGSLKELHAFSISYAGNFLDESKLFHGHEVSV